MAGWRGTTEHPRKCYRCLQTDLLPMSLIIQRTLLTAADDDMEPRPAIGARHLVVLMESFLTL